MTTLEISRQARRRMRIAARLPTRHPRQIDHVSTAIDQLPEPDTLNAEERAAALTAIARQRNRLDAYLTTLAGHADDNHDSQILGAGTTGTLITAATRCDPATGSAAVNRAKGLREHPHLHAAYQAGTLSTSHVAAILADATRIDDFHTLEADLVTLATTTEPREVRNLLRILVDQSRPDHLDNDFAKQRDKRGISLNPLPGGNYRLDGHLDPITGKRLADALSDLMTRTGPDDTRTPTQRRADALADLLSAAQANRKPFGISGVSILIDADTIGAGHLDDATLIGARLTDLLTCDPILSLIIGRTTSSGFQPLRLDRLARHATHAQRQALAARDRGCIRCGAPPARCEAHHIIGWASGGTTDLENLALLCSRCHHDLHLGHFTITMTNAMPTLGPGPRAPPRG